MYIQSMPENNVDLINWAVKSTREKKEWCIQMLLNWNCCFGVLIIFNENFPLLSDSWKDSIK